MRYTVLQNTSIDIVGPDIGLLNEYLLKIMFKCDIKENFKTLSLQWR